MLRRPLPSTSPSMHDASEQSDLERHVAKANRIASASAMFASAWGCMRHSEVRLALEFVNVSGESVTRRYVALAFRLLEGPELRRCMLPLPTCWWPS